MITTGYRTSIRKLVDIYDVLVLVTDAAGQDEVVPDAANRALDQTPAEHSRALAAALEAWMPRVVIYDDLRGFVAEASSLERALVFPNWSGHSSRNRTALVAAVCEAAGLPYLGADAYLRTVFFDKMLGKELCRAYGLEVAGGISVRAPEDVHWLSLPPGPWVCKPSMEGSSIGIDEGSLVHDREAARSRVVDMLARFEQPILLESFVPGSEITICLLGTSEGPPRAWVGEWVSPAGEDFFHHNLFTAALKPTFKASLHLRDVTDTFPAAELNKARALFSGIGKVDFLRVDGRLTPDGRFVVIEGTVDIDFSPFGEFAGLPMLAGASYEEVVGRWLSIAPTPPESAGVPRSPTAA